MRETLRNMLEYHRNDYNLKVLNHAENFQPVLIQYRTYVEHARELAVTLYASATRRDRGTTRATFLQVKAGRNFFANISAMSNHFIDSLAAQDRGVDR